MLGLDTGAKAGVIGFQQYSSGQVGYRVHTLVQKPARKRPRPMTIAPLRVTNLILSTFITRGLTKMLPPYVSPYAIAPTRDTSASCPLASGMLLALEV